MGKKIKRAPNMQRRPSKKQQAQLQAEAQSSGEGGSTTYYVHGPRGIHAQQENGEWKWMVQNGLVYLRELYYNPAMGTFPSQDPIEGSMDNPMSLNRYAYAQGNPVNMTDPCGKLP